MGAYLKQLLDLSTTCFMILCDMNDITEHPSVAPLSPTATSMGSCFSDDDADYFYNCSSSDEEFFYDSLVSPECETFDIPPPPTDGSRLLPVFPQILSYFIGQLDGYKTLYNASLLCKALSPHALDALWRELPDLSPIYAILPTNNANNDWKYDSWNPVFDWVSFHAYSRRVHALSFTPNQRSAEVANSVREIHPEPLLPNLRSLHITVIRDHCPFELMRFLKFIPSTVTFVSIEGVPEPSTRGHAATISLLKMMGMVPSYFTDAFTDLHLSAAVSSELLQQLFLFKSLKRLSLAITNTGISTKEILQLGSLPLLLTLQLSFESSARFSNRYTYHEVPPCETNFRNLEVLRVSGLSEDICAIVYLLTRNPLQFLHTLDFTYTQGTYPTSQEITVITVAFPKTRHLKIHVMLEVPSTNPPSSSHISESSAIVSTTTATRPLVARLRADETLWSLLTFSGAIRSIEFSGVQVLTQGCDIIPICETGSGFYNLHTLHLTCFDDNETLTLNTISVFSSNLPHLKILSLHVCLANHNSAELQLLIDESELRPPHALEHLFLNNTNNMSMITDRECVCVIVGSFIHSMFPSLKKIGIFKTYPLQVEDDITELANGLDSATDTRSVGRGWWRGVFDLIMLLQNKLSKTQPEVALA